LIALYIKIKLFTTVLDGYTVLLVDLVNELNQTPFCFLGDVFAFETTI